MAMKLFSPASSNLKTASIGELDEFMRWKIETKLGGGQFDDLRELKRRVPWLFRGVNLVADKVSQMPFQVLDDSGEVVDDTDNWQGALPFFKDFTNILWLVTSSLMMRGKAYILPEANRLAKAQGTFSSFRYFNSDTIEPKISAKDGLEKFIRRVPQLPPQDISPEDLLYFWLLDEQVELGEPRSYPAQAALDAAGVLFSLDEFFRAHVKSGLVKAFIASAKGMNDPNERDKFKNLLERSLTGIRNFMRFLVVNADSVTVQPVGEGFADLQKVTLTQDKREDISVALGVPMTYLWSSQAGGLGGGGVSKEDTFRLYDGTIIPLFQFIAGVFNSQLFEGMGYQIRDKKESLEVFQEDESTRATALASLRSSGIPLLIAMDILGFDLTDEQRANIENDQLASRAAKEQLAQNLQDAPNQNTLGQMGGKTFVVADNVTANHLDKWKRKALKSLASGKSASVEFESDEIAPSLKASVIGALESAKDEGAVKSVFTDAASWGNYP